MVHIFVALCVPLTLREKSDTIKEAGAKPGEFVSSLTPEAHRSTHTHLYATGRQNCLTLFCAADLLSLRFVALWSVQVENI